MNALHALANRSAMVAGLGWQSDSKVCVLRRNGTMHRGILRQLVGPFIHMQQGVEQNRLLHTGMPLLTAGPLAGCIGLIQRQNVASLDSYDAQQWHTQHMICPHCQYVAPRRQQHTERQHPSHSTAPRCQRRSCILTNKQLLPLTSTCIAGVRTAVASPLSPT